MHQSTILKYTPRKAMPPISTCTTSSLFERTDTNDIMITNNTNNQSNENQQNNTIETTTTITNNSSNKSSNMECKVIRDEVQSHNDDSSTNLYEKTSVFASVSPLSCQETHQEQNSIQQHQQIETNNNHEIDINNNNKNQILSSHLFDTQPKPVMVADSVVDTSILESQTTTSSTATEPATNTCLKEVLPTMTTNLNNAFVASNVQSSISSVSTKKSIKRKRPSSKHPTNATNISNQLSLAITTSMENNSSHTSTTALSGNGTTGRWTVQEHEAFVRGLALYGREWKRVALDIPTRTSAQVRSHAQKYLTKMEKQLEFMNHRPTSTSSALSINTKTPPVAQYISSNEIINDTSGNVTITKSNQSPSTRFRNNNEQDDTTSSSQHDIDGSPNNNNDQNSNDEYMTMSDSVRQQAARILANPTTVEQEVRETITQLRKRYQLLQERIQAQQQQQQSSLDKYDNNRDHKTITSSNSHRYNVTNHHHHDHPPTIGTTFYIPHHDHDDDELIALHVLQGLQKQQQQQQSLK